MKQLHQLHEPYAVLRRYRHVLIVLCLTLMLAGCVVPEALIVQPPAATVESGESGATVVPPPPAPLGDDAPAHIISPHLQAALAHAPITTETFAFTDWTYLKRVAGVHDLTSADSIDERFDFMRGLGVETQAVAAHFGGAYFFQHAENWGWDATDLLWETLLYTDGPPLFVLRFRDDFDFAPVIARLEERHYSLLDHNGIPLYSHRLELTQGWQRTSEFAILNIAYLAEEKLFILASSPDTVTTALDAIAQDATLINFPGMAAVAAELGETGSAILTPLGCQPLDLASIAFDRDDPLQALIERMEESGGLNPFTVLGIGYRMGEIDGAPLPLGRIVMHYPVGAMAEADLEARRALAENGQSLARSVPYAELFEVIDARVAPVGDGSANLVLDLHAHERTPQLFFDMFYRRDLRFAACGG